MLFRSTLEQISRIQPKVRIVNDGNLGQPTCIEDARFVPVLCFQTITVVDTVIVRSHYLHINKNDLFNS